MIPRFTERSVITVEVNLTTSIWETSIDHYAAGNLFDQYRKMHRPEKWLKPWHMGIHLSTQRELSSEYQHDRV